MSEFDTPSKYQLDLANQHYGKNWLGRLKEQGVYYPPSEFRYDPNPTPKPNDTPQPQPNPQPPDIIGEVTQEVKGSRVQKYSNWATWITYVFFVGVIVAIIFKLFSSYRDVSIGRK